ncbi:MAG TPA: trehalose-6-phosphate synthase [Gemmatimonadales bacterium]
MTTDLVVLAHREPYEERPTATGIQRVLKTNGVFRTLDAVLRERRGTWIAWRQQDPGARWDATVDAPTDEAGARYRIRRIPLSKDEARRFYYEFTSTAIWPVLFSLLDRARFTQDAWATYEEVNARFADAVCDEASIGATVWINDFHLMLAPRLIKQQRPDLTLVLFLHTAFPPPDTFAVIPWRNELLDSLLHLDEIGFHIPSYALNFANTAERFVGAVPMAPVEVDVTADRPAVAVSRYPSRLEYQGRTVALGAYPVGVDVTRLEEIASAPETEAARRRIREGIGEGRLILSAERLDYVKGFLERLESFERYLERHPKEHGRVAFVQIAVPTRTGMEESQEMRRLTEERVGRINGRFGSLEWQPVHFFHKALPLDELVAFYRAADVAWVTPLRDGLNLVSKEYVASRVDGDGVLVLSEFAGAAAELHDAVFTNPYSPDDMDRGLEAALRMPEAARRARMARLRSHVRERDVQWWARAFLQDANRVAAAPVAHTPAA